MSASDRRSLEHISGLESNSRSFTVAVTGLLHLEVQKLHSLSISTQKTNSSRAFGSTRKDVIFFLAGRPIHICVHRKRFVKVDHSFGGIRLQRDIAGSLTS